MNKLFFHKIVNNTIICKSAPLLTVETEINGKKVQVREQAQVTFGLLCLVGPDGKTVNPAGLGLKANQAMPGFRLSKVAVMDQDDPTTETGMFWVEAI